MKCKYKRRGNLLYCYGCSANNENPCVLWEGLVYVISEYDTAEKIMSGEALCEHGSPNTCDGDSDYKWESKREV
jgi:hypothetical protein